MIGTECFTIISSILVFAVCHMRCRPIYLSAPCTEEYLQMDKSSRLIEEDHWTTYRGGAVTTPTSKARVWRARFQFLKQRCLRANLQGRKRIIRQVLYRLFGPVFKRHYQHQAKRTALAIDWKNIYCGEKRGLVSVVLPVYNQSDVLQQSIESVLSQQYENFELIIVNDGSTDGIEKMLDKYVTHPKILILTQKNQKLPTALNSGFAHASGEFLTWTSADNIMLPAQLTEQVGFLRANTFVQMVYCNYELIDERDKAFEYPTLTVPGTCIVDTDKDVRSLTYTYNFINACFLYRRYVPRIIGHYSSDMYGAEDYDYWMRVSNHFAIQHIGRKESFYKYRLHGNTILRREGEATIEEAIKKAQRLNSQRQLFFCLPMRLYAPKNLLFNKGKGDWSSGESGLELIQFENSRVLHNLVSNNRRSEKSALFLTNAQMKQGECLSFLRRHRHGEFLFKIGIIDGDINEDQRDAINLLDWIVVGTRELYDSLCGDFKNKLLCLPSWHNYLRLYVVAANHQLFYRRLGQENVCRIPEHSIYRSETNRT